ncbi:MAG: GNAT family N-acetyltransferase [Bryobacteraceae bacterium]
MPAALSAPEKLTAAHDVSLFDSGQPVLDLWLRRRALQNERAGASRTYVVCAKNRVAGYYSLAVGAVAHEHAPGRVRRNMPDPVPVMIVGRLAVDLAFQGLGIGTGLLKDAVLRTLQAAEIAGIRALLVHALSPDAKRFYEQHGFTTSPLDPMTVMLTLDESRRLLASASR